MNQLNVRGALGHSREYYIWFNWITFALTSNSIEYVSVRGNLVNFSEMDLVITFTLSSNSTENVDVRDILVGIS